MLDSEKVVGHLNDCMEASRRDNTWVFVRKDIVADALALLKEHEARVMALDELTEIYVEFKGNNFPVRLTNFDLQKIVKHAVDGDCRLWTGKPTDEQKQAVKWE